MCQKNVIRATLIGMFVLNITQQHISTMRMFSELDGKCLFYLQHSILTQ